MIYICYIKKNYLFENGIQCNSDKLAKVIFKSFHHPQNDSYSYRVTENSSKEINQEKSPSQTSVPDILPEPLIHPWTFSHLTVISVLTKNSADNNSQLITRHLTIHPL